MVDVRLYEITLSSTESGYTGLSYALREAIPIMDLLKELKEAGLSLSQQARGTAIRFRCTFDVRHLCTLYIPYYDELLLLAS